MTPTTMTPPTPIEAYLATLNRDQIGGFVEIAIGILDRTDGDPDIEDATGAEDAFETHHPDGPGCPIADAGEYLGDETDGNFGEDEFAARFDRISSGPGCQISDHDKSVDDDPIDGLTEDGV